MPKFRLLRGHHIVGDRLYKPGEIIETESNLLKFNSTDSFKFERLVETAPVESPASVAPPSKAQDDGLDQMTVAQLKSYAEEIGLDLLGVNKKEEIIATIRRNLN